MSGSLRELGRTPMPAWARWLALAALCLSAYGTGRVQEARHAADAMADRGTRMAIRSARIAQAQASAITMTSDQYRDRIRKIFDRGATIEAAIPTHIQPADSRLFAVPTGLVRVLDAAWSGTDPGPAAGSDREPAAIPFERLAGIEAGNATSCRAWREQALFWRVYYARLQRAVNGKAGEWANAIDLDDRQ
jgi:hypothetical protein